MHACALRLTGNAQLAEEITQDVFVRLVREAQSIRFDSALATWLYRVTLNRCFDRLRSEARAPCGNPLDERELASIPSPIRTEELLETRERRTALDDALAQLPAPLREVVVLRYAAGFEYHEIANTLDIPAGSVASRLYRALRQLGALLEARGLNAESLL